MIMIYISITDSIYITLPKYKNQELKELKLYNKQITSYLNITL